MTTRETPAAPPTVADALLGWDRLGFRVLVLGALGLLWILQGRVAGLPWGSLIRGEVAGIGPWILLAPLVPALSARVRHRGRGVFLAAHLAGLVAVALPYWLMQRSVLVLWETAAAGWSVDHLRVFVPTLKSALTLFVGNIPLFYLILLSGSEAMVHAQARREEALQAGQLAGQLASARLALLQRQLHPHFLFNALQALSTLVHRDPAAADALLVRLSSLLRAMLDQASGQRLPLGVELDLVRKYVEIEQVRFGERLRVTWSVDEALRDLPVPSLCVLPLVENAIRHGLAPKVGPVSLSVAAAREGEVLRVTVQDDGLGAALPVREGVGLANTRERLKALCGEEAALGVETAPGAGFKATLCLPWVEGVPEGRP